MIVRFAEAVVSLRGPGACHEMAARRRRRDMPNLFSDPVANPDQSWEARHGRHDEPVRPQAPGEG
jgi:hypothetical protein